MPRKKITAEEVQVNQEVGERIKRYREFRKMSQEAVADAIGMTLNQYFLYEKGKGDIRIGILHKISQCLNIPVMEFLPPCEGFETLPKDFLNLMSVISMSGINCKELVEKIKNGEVA